MAKIKTVEIITKKELDSFINHLINDGAYDVVGVKDKNNRFVFGPLTNAGELRLDYDVTILPPKKYFLPQYETLMEYNLEKQFEVNAKNEIKSKILIGIHPYDIIALKQMDKVYLDSQKDDFYKKRRENTIVIASDIQNVSERSFASSMNTNTTDKGFDLLLTYLDDKYAVTIGSEKGNHLLKKYAKTEEARDVDIKKIDETRKKTLNKYKKKGKFSKKRLAFNSC